MPKLIYKMGGVTADGYIVGPDGEFDWSVPDDELFPIPHGRDARTRRARIGTPAVRDDVVLGAG